MIAACLPIKSEDLLAILREAGREILRIGAVCWCLIIGPFALVFYLVAKFAPELRWIAFCLFVLAAFIVAVIGILVVRKC